MLRSVISGIDYHPFDLDLPGFTTAMDGGSAAIGKEPMRPTAMDGGNAGAAGSGSCKNLEGLPIGLFPA